MGLPKTEANLTHVELPLVGGLGNQLFVLAFGKFLASNMTLDVELLESRQSFGNETHGVRLQAELVDSQIGLRVLTQTRVSWFGDRMKVNFVKGDVAKGGPFLQRKRYCTEPEFLELFDLELIEQFREIKSLGFLQVQGYFQDERYLSHLQSIGVLEELEPKAPSRWYQNQLLRIRDGGKIGIHVRRGDTVGIPGYGVLSTDFYKEALELFAENNPGGFDVLLFTDQTSVVAEEFQDLIRQFKIEIVDPPNGTKPVESLSLMSQCSSLVAGNSTFGWWAANTGNLSKRVIAPSTWSPSGKLPVGSCHGQNLTLIAPSWTSVEA
jgi:hypothetical protein